MHTTSVHYYTYAFLRFIEWTGLKRTNIYLKKLIKQFTICKSCHFSIIVNVGYIVASILSHRSASVVVKWISSASEGGKNNINHRYSFHSMCVCLENQPDHLDKMFKCNVGSQNVWFLISLRTGALKISLAFMNRLNVSFLLFEIASLFVACHTEVFSSVFY